MTTNRLTSLLSIALLLYVWAPANAQNNKKMNVLFILIDDLGWADTQPYGTSFYETPHLSRLAAESMKFTNAYAASPVCSPTRSSIMSGKYPGRTRTSDWFGAARPEEISANPARKSLQKLLPAWYERHMSLEETTMAEAFKQNGYTTFFAGKWHLGETEKFWPQNQGFEINLGGHSAGHPPTYFSPYTITNLEEGPEGEYLTDRLADETAKFIGRNKDKPFFAYFSMYAVHTPIEGKKALIEKYIKKKEQMGIKDQFGTERNKKFRMNQGDVEYAAMIESMDQAVGTVVQKLKDEGLYDNTIIMFFSDNGGEAFADQRPTSNQPLRAGKGWMYEGGIREPLLVRWPGHTKPGSVSNCNVVSTDFYPTLLQMNGLSLMPSQHIDGVSFAKALDGLEYNRKPLVVHYPHYGNQGGAPGTVLIDGDWKLIRWYEDNSEELFNLKIDMGEKNNLIAQNPQKASRLRKMMNTSLKDQHALLPTVNPNYKP